MSLAEVLEKKAAVAKTTAATPAKTSTGGAVPINVKEVAKTTTAPKTTTTTRSASSSSGGATLIQISSTTTETTTPVMGPTAPPGYTGGGTTTPSKPTTTETLENALMTPIERVVYEQTTPKTTTTQTQPKTFKDYADQGGMPVGEYQQYLANKQSESVVREQETKAKLTNESANINPSALYKFNTGVLPPLPTTFPLPGSAIIKINEKQAKGYSEEEYRNQLQAESNRVGGFDPETRVKSTVKGFEYNFPYAGAEHYQEYKNILLNQDIGGKLATGVTTAFSPQDPLGLKTLYYVATGDKENVLRTKIQSMGAVNEIKGSGGLLSVSFAKYWLESPTTQIGLAVVGGNILGRGVGYSSGYLTQIGRVGTAKAVNIGVGALGVGLGAIQSYDIYKSIKSKDYAGAFAKGGMLGFEIVGGIAGFKLGQASGYQSGAEKGFNKYLSTEYKKGNVDATIYNASKDVLSSGKFLSKQGYDFAQKPMPGFSDVQSVKNQPGLREYLWEKTSATKSELFGGTVGQKPGGTHDIDVFMKPKTKAYTGYSSKALTGEDVANFADVKMPQKPGSITSEFGNIKKSPFTVEVEEKEFLTMRGSEQFNRLYQSSLRPAHSGRLKDMPEAIRISKLMFEGKTTPEIETNLVKFETGMKTLYGYGEKNPLISSQIRSESIYGPGLGEKIYKVKVKFWEKVTPESKFKADINKFTLTGKKSILTEGYMPSSPSSSFIFPSSTLGGIASSSISNILSPSNYGGISSFKADVIKFTSNVKKSTSIEIKGTTPTFSSSSIFASSILGASASASISKFISPIGFSSRSKISKNTSSPMISFSPIVPSKITSSSKSSKGYNYNSSKGYNYYSPKTSTTSNPSKYNPSLSLTNLSSVTKTPSMPSPSKYYYPSSTPSLSLVPSPSPILNYGVGGVGGGYGGGVFEADWKHRKRQHGVRLLFKEIIIPKIYLKNW